MIDTGLPLPGAILIIINTFALLILLLVAMKSVHDCTKHNNIEQTDSHLDQIDRIALLLASPALGMIVTGAQTTGFTQHSLP